jgi:hypothetical protein
MILGAKPSKEYAIHLQSNAACSDKKKNKWLHKVNIQCLFVLLNAVSRTCQIVRNCYFWNSFPLNLFFKIIIKSSKDFEANRSKCFFVWQTRSRFWINKKKGLFFYVFFYNMFSIVDFLSLRIHGLVHVFQYVGICISICKRVFRYWTVMEK